MCKRIFWCLEIQIQKKGHADKTDAVHLSKMTIFSGSIIGGRSGITGEFHYFILGIHVISEIIARTCHVSMLDLDFVCQLWICQK